MIKKPIKKRKTLKKHLPRFERMANKSIFSRLAKNGFAEQNISDTTTSGLTKLTSNIYASAITHKGSGKAIMSDLINRSVTQIATYISRLI